MGRGVAARICRSAEHLRPTSVDSELSSFCEDHPEAQPSLHSAPNTHCRRRTECRPVNTSGSSPPEQIRSIGSPRASRRLVLIGGGGSSQFASWSEPSPRSVEVRDEPVADVVGEVEESDTESLPWSIAGDEEVVPHTVEDRVVDVGLPRNVVLRMALSLLDDVDTSVVFRQMAAIMRLFPISCAVHTGMPWNWLWKKLLGGITAWTWFDRKEDGNSSCCCPGCYSTDLQVLISKEKLVGRFQMFARGEWILLLRASATCDEQAAKTRYRKCHRDGDDVERRIMRVGRLVELGELSSARQALEGAAVAPGDQATLDKLQDERRRPQQPSHFHQT